MIHVRASSMPLIATCAASAVRPEHELPMAHGGQAADLGTAAHAWLLTRIGGDPREQALIEHLASTHGVDRSELAKLTRWCWTAWQSVQKFFPDPETEVEIKWKDDAAGIVLTGHLDILSVAEADGHEGRIADAKTGRLDHEYSAQMRSYAWLVSRKMPTRRSYCVVLKIRDQIIAPVNDGREPGYYHADELSEWWTRMVARIHAAEYNPGPWCRFCPRSHECPAIDRALAQARRTLAETMMEGTVAEIAASLPTDPGELGAVGAMIKDAGSLLASRFDKWTDALRARVVAAGGRVPTGDGRELVVTTIVQRKIDYNLGLPVVQRFLTEDAIAECVRISKTDTETAVKASVGRGQKTARIKDLLDQLEAANALIEQPIERLEIKRAAPVTPGMISN